MPRSKVTTCPTCFETDKERRDSCVNKPVGMCPRPVSLPENHVIEVKCAAPCGGRNGKHLAIPIGSVMKRRQLTNLGTCAFDKCRARVIVSSPAQPKASTPPPIKETSQPTVNGTEQQLPSEPPADGKA